MCGDTSVSEVNLVSESWPRKSTHARTLICSSHLIRVLTLATVHATRSLDVLILSVRLLLHCDTALFRPVKESEDIQFLTANFFRPRTCGHTAPYWQPSDFDNWYLMTSLARLFFFIPFWWDRVSLKSDFGNVTATKSLFYNIKH